VLYRNADYSRRAATSEKLEGREDYRTEFRRDFQRLVHSPAFRRLTGKTQLFPSEEHDFYRNRLTHSLEVAQVAKSIAIKLNATHPRFLKQHLDTDLVEFAGLAHDLGHPPFGHNGEHVLDKLMIKYGGFEGNAQTLRIISCLEKKATAETPATRQFADDGTDIRRGLNPTNRSLASVLKYDKLIPKTEEVRQAQKNHEEPCKGYYSTEELLVRKLKDALGDGHKGRFKTIECAIMDVADDIAYSTSDIEDAFVAGFLTPISILATEDSAKQKIADRIAAKIAVEFPELTPQQRGFTVDEMNGNLVRVFSSILQIDESHIGSRDWSGEDLATYVGGEVFKASTLLAKSSYHRTQFTSDLIGFLINKVEIAEFAENPVFWQARLQLDAFKAVETLKLITFTQLIQSDKFLAEGRRAQHILERIFTALVESGANLLPSDWRAVYKAYQDDEPGKKRAVCDFISGMTNRYCLEFYARLFGPEPPSIHKP
jgi:dGTPase